MDKKSKILLTILVIATVASLAYAFYSTVIRQNITIVNIEPTE